ncbi:MAG: 50S ribosomal protein L13e [Candidatus Methanomethylicota archaeon]|nr:MAG: 50S ribosomal protein L13e [Candidatus Verstraetearchaeota archaeon]
MEMVKVKTPRLKVKGRILKEWKEGRGFSKGEVMEAGISISEARRMKLRIDKRRRSKHQENIEILKKLVSNKLEAGVA